MTSGSIGLIAGSGTFPFLFARAAKEQGLTVHAVAHRGEADPALEAEVESFTWVKLGQAKGILTALKKAGVDRAVMAGGIGRARSLREAWPDAGAWAIAKRLRGFRDDELLRAIAAYFEEGGVRIVAPTDFVKQVLAPKGLLAGPKLTAAQERDVEIGREVALSLGKADVGQTVVVKDGAVVAVEAVEGTDEAIRRGGHLGGKGAVVVKRVKPGQDLRFDLPAAGPVTLEVMREVGARVLAVEAGRTVLLDGPQLFKLAERLGISVVGM
ncbi:MAG: UDP-2,3-diacylglucosamine diphosphatase LpxI [Myxococcaceae bacterium]|nr:UDP-2,3-diacylglucosamine diphosphatase LpxI [Myxococcaceae bacterium]